MTTLRLILLLLLGSVSTGSAAGLTRVTDLIEILRADPGARIMVVTGITQTVSTYIYSSNLVHSMTNYPGWPTGLGGGGSTETQWIPMPSQFETNAAGQFWIKGGASVTNVDFWGTTEFFGEVRADSLKVTNSAVFYGTVGFTGQTPEELLYTSPGGGLTSVPGVSPTEAGYLNGVTSALQTQLDAKASITQLNIVSNQVQVASNSLLAQFVANDTTTSNGVLTASRASDIVTSNSLVTLSSNNVRVVAGTGGGSVDSAGSGGVQTYTVNFPAGGTGSLTTLRTNAGVAGTNLISLLLTNAAVASPVEAQVSSNGSVATISYSVKNLSGGGNILASNAPTMFDPIVLGNLSGVTAEFTGAVSLGSLNVDTTSLLQGVATASTSLITPRLQATAISNVTIQVTDPWHLNGATNHWISEVTSNTTAVLTNLFLNTPVFLTVSNRGSFTISFNCPAASWRGLNGAAPILAANGVTEYMFVKVGIGQTNAYVLSEPYQDLAGGWGNALVTNTPTISIVATNRSVGIATNAATAFISFNDTDNTQIYNVGWHLTAALACVPTNLVAGRTVCIYFPTNSLTYTVTVTNGALTTMPVKWNWNVTTNGLTSFTKTNTLSARVYLTAETNGVLSAEMGYYR